MREDINEVNEVTSKRMVCDARACTAATGPIIIWISAFDLALTPLSPAGSKL